MILQEEVIKKIKEEVKEKIKETPNYSDKITQCTQILTDIAIGKVYKDLNPTEHTINVLYGEIPGEIFGPIEPYFTILLSGWNLLNHLQVENNRYVYKASIAAFLAMNYRLHGNNGATFRWSLLTQIEDLLHNHKEGGGTGKDLLTSEFGFDDIVLRKLIDIYENNIAVVNKKQDWSIPEAFSEDIFVKFAFKYPEYSLKFASDTRILEYGINPHYFDSLMNRINKEASNTKEKGDALEDLATYLFLLISGLVPRRNILSGTKSFESDIVVRNFAKSSNVISDIFGRYVLVECKNWEKPVDVQHVGYFLYRMRLTHSNFGILFAKDGITGDDTTGESAARSLIRMAFHEDGNTCIVIDEKILKLIGNQSLTFLSCLISENEKLRFGSER